MLPEKGTGTEGLAPFYANVQSHYDLSDDFFALFLDPSRTYSCAYFEREGMSLEEAQLAKIDLALGKCDLRPGMTLLDVGCGWGSTMLRAMERYDVDVIGLTLSRNQYEHVEGLLEAHRGPRRGRVLLRGWEEFDEPVDRIVSIGAFEHFRRERYEWFFDKCHRILPADGRMLLHTIVQYNRQELRAKGLPIDREVLAFGRFIAREIFPGGQLPLPEWVLDYARAAGFDVERAHSLGPNYVTTLEHWANALEKHRDEAIAVTSEEIYDTYSKYLSGCGRFFRDGYIDVVQFSLAKK
ncbi:cyclopropane mycolic acid synthase family methyltransferase [Nocardia bhagyanarayanae]|uniref:Cyclopropane-fatty-acyl-phospholipid synthase n=1 Tax=Nocardia bhagyanarayanae TaxID=1215925 RepID=A0A543EXW6_9NOCA|nr:cyclopropane mycolic acid synthase family methyltransferase [Nocardia bhagyanarayanae]TQM26394.1 cyclopropane-fatty-acyl-phospholipid synthase [Nocardia bhagyanarayanae]